MNFKDNKPIYLQIAELITKRIATGEWAEEERIPSVRDLGMELGVNPNTCMRTYDTLTREGIIENQRGIGYFVTKGASDKILNMSRNKFINKTLPEMFSQMKTLNISIEELTEYYNKY